jgi:uncharacterized protein involved in type VI secretion and phage assembly
MNDAKDLQEVLDRLRNRFFGKYRGTVVDVDASKMSLRAEVSGVVGVTVTGWCEPCVPYAGPSVGFFMLPEVGSGVWIEFAGGEVSHPIWVGCYWREGQIPSSTDASVKTITTTAGSLSLDTGASSITLAGAQNQTAVLDSQGITLNAGSGTIAVGSSGVDINNGGLTVT